jgi:hypothetical protein
VKKLFSVLSILVIVSPLFSQNANSQITDYFPIGIGNTWNYANASGKIMEVSIIRNSMPDNVSNDGTSLYLFERQFVGIGNGSTLYSIKQNKALIMVEKNIFGQYRQKSPLSLSWLLPGRSGDTMTGGMIYGIRLLNRLAHLTAKHSMTAFWLKNKLLTAGTFYGQKRAITRKALDLSM